MKKLISLTALAVLLAVFLCACGKFTCDICGEEKTGKKHKMEVDILDTEVVYCDDCYNALDELAGVFG